MINEPSQSLEDINFSSTAFVEDTCELEHAHGNVWTVKRRISSAEDPEEKDDLSEFGELHLNQGLDGIVRLDALRKKRSLLLPSRRLFCLLTVALTAIAVTTVSVVLVPSNNGSSSPSESVNNAYDDKVNEIYQYFITNGVSSETNLRQAGSPHYKALRWIAVHPGSQVVGSEPFLARYVMVLTYFAVGGPLFTFDSPMCEWFRKDGNDPSGIACDDEGLPVALHFDGLGLAGQIPSEMGLLTTLQHLNLGRNALQGSLPAELCNLHDLESLHLLSNRISGSVPACLGTMTNLQVVNLNFNKMSGALPEDGFVNVRQMYLNSNRFSQDLSKLVASMNQLVEFSGRENQFYGDIEFAFDHVAGQLVVLDLMANQQLMGEFPHRLLYGAPNLEVLALGDNALQGKLTWGIPLNDKLRFLSIYNNKLEGMIPPSISNLTALTHFIAYNNQFAGPLPQSLPTGVRSLFLSDNHFYSGPIPESWASLSNMVAFHIGGNNRTGELPSWIGKNWTELELLDLGRNNFEGSVPYSWGELQQLEYLFLNENQLISGPLPESFQSLTNLKQVLLLQTGISGNWQYMCQSANSDTSVLVSNADGCSCCVLCNDWSCENEFVKGFDASFEWKYRSYWGV